MARGHQKLQSQAKAQEKTAKIKKQQGHSAVEQKKAAAKALNISCFVCKVKSSRQHPLIYSTFTVGGAYDPKIFNISVSISVSNARPKDIQATFREQTSKMRSSSRIKGGSCLK